MRSFSQDHFQIPHHHFYFYTGQWKVLSLFIHSIPLYMRFHVRRSPTQLYFTHASYTWAVYISAQFLHANITKETVLQHLINSVSVGWQLSTSCLQGMNFNQLCSQQSPSTQEVYTEETHHIPFPCLYEDSPCLWNFSVLRERGGVGRGEKDKNLWGWT